MSCGGDVGTRQGEVHTVIGGRRADSQKLGQGSDRKAKATYCRRDTCATSASHWRDRDATGIRALCAGCRERRWWRRDRPCGRRAGPGPCPMCGRKQSPPAVRGADARSTATCPLRAPRGRHCRFQAAPRERGAAGPGSNGRDRAGRSRTKGWGHAASSARIKQRKSYIGRGEVRSVGVADLHPQSLLPAGG